MIRSSLPALVLALASLTSCATIPEVDSVPPRVELRVNGPGAGGRAMSNPPRETWTGPGGPFLNLQERTEYAFSYIVTDQGGVSRATLSLPASIEIVDLEPGDVENVISGVSRRLTVRGDRADPSRVLAISGRFTTRGNANLSFDFSGESSDFGGRSGAVNQTFLAVATSIGLALP